MTEKLEKQKMQKILKLNFLRLIHGRYISNKTTKIAKVEVVKLKSPIRLVLYGGARSLGDNGAFFTHLKM